MRSTWILVAALVGCGDNARGTLDAASQGADAAIDTPAAAPSPLRINEVMPSNVAACADGLGGHADWVELYNPSAVDVDLGGYTVTDDLAVPLKSTLLPGLIVPAHGYRMLWCDDDVEQGPDHVAFKLSAAGESFAIFDPSITQVDSFTWTNAVNDVAYARIPDGTGDFATCAATCASTNGTSCATAARAPEGPR